MGNNCIKNKENQLLKLKGGYPLITPQKQHSIQQFTYDMKLNLDSFEDEFFQKDYQINQQVQQDRSRIQQKDSIDFVIEEPIFHNQSRKNYFIQRNNSAPVKKTRKRPYHSMNCSKYIIYEIPKCSNQKKIKSNSRSLSKNIQPQFIQKIEGHKPRKSNNHLSNKLQKLSFNQIKTDQRIEQGKKKKDKSCQFQDSVKIIF
ncbi:unnamed protein product [Paramecium sonneborni]|uniref:Uncharacterized protein n=1 Tax=Paramecium sonneborni TaxID=65129 RepID=A0A8S1PX51_9CILI|nr:unnamed protein product [Paramecium sonneborni]